MRFIKKYFFFALAAAGMSSCTKLDEKLNSQLTEAEFNSLSGGSGTADVNALLRGVYLSMLDPYANQDQLFALNQHTTDETIGPTRGGDWDDGGTWRVMHSHQWDANHPYIANTYRNLLRTSFSATDLLRFNPAAQAGAEARFLRAFTNYEVLDGFDQVPYREKTTDANEVPKVRKGSEALDYIIKEITEILPNLPDNGPAFQATKNAARVLLMKSYLNRAVFKNRQTPTFEQADMNQVISLADQIIAQNKYSLTSNYFDVFAPTNNLLSNELIFTLGYRDAAAAGGGTSGNGVMYSYHASLHYNSPIQNGGGWNGFTTLSDFYDKFSANDKRREANYPWRRPVERP
jgi:starch-binding outer membrane protein, SusD/RagB family